MNITEEIVGSGDSFDTGRRINKISINGETFDTRENMIGGNNLTKLSYSPEWRNVYKLRFQVPIESKQLQMKLLGTPPSVFADNPPTYDDVMDGGKGFFDDDDELVMLGGGAFFEPELDKYPKESLKVLQQYGNYPIVKLTVFRTPLKEFNNYLVNIVSLGSYDKIRKELGTKYDKMYHLGLVATTRDYSGNIKDIIIEKHARVMISTKIEVNKKTETMPVDIQGKSLTINILTEELRNKQGNKYYFAYSALGGNNCQNFVLEMLKIPRLLTPELEKFIYQDLTPILKNIAPHTKGVSDFITNFWAWKDKLLGRGDFFELEGMGDLMYGSTLHSVAGPPFRHTINYHDIK